MDRYCEVRFSKDRGNTWSAWKRRSLGALGQFYVHVIVRMLGQGRDWRIHVRSSSPINRDLLGAVAQVTRER